MGGYPRALSEDYPSPQDQGSVIESPDIELLCCIKNIDLCIGRRMIAMRQKSTSKMMKLSLDLETIGT